MTGDTDKTFTEELRPGLVLDGRYEIEKELARGGIGIVFQALDHRISRRVVIKVLLQEIEDSFNGAYFRRKFRHEIEALSRIKHPAVVEIYDTGETDDGKLYIVMEFIEGTSLRSVLNDLRNQSMEFDRVAHILRQIGQAISAVHKMKVYHRDLKPENIMLHSPGDGEEMVKIIDFGIATVRDSQIGTTKTTTAVAGTLAYMAPEQFMGKPQAASDIYALGIIAYEMLAGRVPFNTKSTVQQYEMQQKGLLPKPKDLCPNLSDAGQEIILKALSFNPKDRQPYARQFAEELAQALTKDSSEEEEVEPIEAPATQSLSQSQPATDPAQTPQPAGGTIPLGSYSGQPPQSETRTLEIVYVLCAEIVGFQDLLTDQADSFLQRLEQIISSTQEFLRAQESKQVLTLDTSGGATLVFLRDPEAPARCALQIAEALASIQDIKVRMGIHMGPAYHRMYSTSRRSVSGEGINIAHKVMSCGDAGHILISATAASFLAQLSRWAGFLHDVGECEITSGARSHLFNLYTPELGNPQTPGRVFISDIAVPPADRSSVVHQDELPKEAASEKSQQSSHTPKEAEPVEKEQEPVTPPPAARPAEAHEQDEKSEKEKHRPVGILTQILGVSHRQDSKGAEGLIYTPVPLDVDEAPESEFVPIKWQILKRHVEEIRVQVDNLTLRALVGKQRENVGLEAVAAELARHVLPMQRFVQMLGAGINPQFDIIQDAASEIPWEVLEERFLACDNGHTLIAHQRPGAAITMHCTACGAQMKWTSAKLALTYHLTHLVRGQACPVSDGKQFLFIEDPEGDLCRNDKDPNGVCANHLQELRRLIEQQGYEINLLAGRNATVGKVLKAISNPSVAGVYYFGHGYFPREGDEGCLVLADGPLFASQIEEAKPRSRFVFLNACEGAQSGRDWSLERRSRSVASAFAKGSRGKVVIAPLWPIVNVQAAEAANEFFKQAAMRVSLGEALRTTRRFSLERYEAGESHLIWTAYRYYGDPNKSLLAAQPARIYVGNESKPRLFRVFDESGNLSTEVFTFAIDEVMLRAAKRRNLQNRRLVTVIDFIAGLVRRGDLTRFVLRRCGADPDAIYEKIGELIEEEAEPGAKSDASSGHRLSSEERLRRAVPKWIVRDIQQFTPQLVRALEEADEQSNKDNNRADDKRISEQKMLEALIRTPFWDTLLDAGMAAAKQVRNVLDERGRTGEVDENGAISLSMLDEEARGIIETAHDLAQQRGVYPITTRLVLAAFLAKKDGYASRVCRKAGVRPSLLYLLMIAASKRSTPRSFGLSPEACEHIIIPLLEAARKLSPKDGLIKVGDLFKALCETAGPGLKEFLSLPALGADLDQLKNTDPDSDDPPIDDRKVDKPVAPNAGRHRIRIFNEEALRVLQAAQAMAAQIGLNRIPNRLMLAAFLINPNGHAATLFEKQGVPPDLVCSALIIAVDGKVADVIVAARNIEKSSSEPDIESFEGVARATIERAQELSAPGKTVSDQVLFKAFCDVAAVEFKRSLKRPPLAIDLDALALKEGPSQANPEARSKGNTRLPGEIVHSEIEISFDAEKGNGEGKHVINPGDFEQDAWRVIVTSAQLAREQGWPQVRSPHLFAAMINEGFGGPVGAILPQDEIDHKKLKNMILSLVPARPQVSPAGMTARLGTHVYQIVRRAVKIANLEGRRRATQEDILTSFFVDGGGVVGDLLRSVGAEQQLAAAKPRQHQFGGSRSVLELFGDDLTDKAKQNLLPEIVGRDAEIETAMQTLQLTENANPLLVGEAGVGKTAIVEAIAMRIAKGRCPRKLENMRVIELSAGRLVANTSYRGEFEQRIQRVLEEARQNVILFIDEIHSIVGAGSAEGGGPDAGNMLKTALARGEIRLIGATTNSEYRRTIARDRALSRRFQVQMIGPPSREATISVLSARQKALEDHHGVRITKRAKIAAVDLSGRFILDKHWPAKARDVLERACVVAATKKGARQGVPSVTHDHVTQVVSRQTGIPMERVSTSQMSALATLEDRVNHRIIGQPAATHSVGEAIRRGRRGLSNKNRPWGVFLFIGPPGVGKTEMAKVICDEVYGGGEGLIRFDMGEFTEPHSVARLIGAPPGYVGHDLGAPLVESLRKRPYSLLLFDEIEHAHEKVLAMLLRLCSEGTLVDCEGNTADARNSIIIMTSNMFGSDQELRRPGFMPDTKSASPESSGNDLRSLLKARLPASLIDRFDAIIRFNALKVEDLEAIAADKLKEVSSNAAALYGIRVEITPDVARWIAERSASESASARAVLREVEKQVANPVAADLVEAQASHADMVRVSIIADAIRIEIVGRAAKMDT